MSLHNTDEFETNTNIDTLSSLASIKQNILQSNSNLKLDLGEGKLIELTKWTGKQLIQYGKVVEQLTDKLSDDNSENILSTLPSTIIDGLIRPNVIDFNKFYFNSYEIKHILFQLRKLSIPSLPIKYNLHCNGTDEVMCNYVADVPVLLNDIVETTQKYNNGVLKLSNGIELTIGNIKNPESIKNKDSDISLINEICMRVKKVSFGAQSTEVIIFDELLDILLSLPSESFTELIETYNKDFGFSQNFETVEYSCPSCSRVHKISVDDMLLYIEGI